jgi:hypothetical protein
MTAVLVVAGISAVAGWILGLYRLAWFTLVPEPLNCNRCGGSITV